MKNIKNVQNPGSADFIPGTCLPDPDSEKAILSPLQSVFSIKAPFDFAPKDTDGTPYSHLRLKAYIEGRPVSVPLPRSILYKLIELADLYSQLYSTETIGSLEISVGRLGSIPASTLNPQTEHRAK